jgi:leucyl aminopeptidase
VLCVGLGKVTKTQPLEMETLRRASGVAARSLVGKSSALFALPTTTTVAAHAVTIGVELGAYSFTEFKTKNEKSSETLKSLSFRNSLKPCDNKQSFSISPIRSPPSFDLPLVGCLVSAEISPLCLE